MKRVRPARVVLIAVVALTALWLVLPTIVAIPVSFTEVRSFSLPPRGFSTEWYANFFTDSRWVGALTNSVIVATCTTLIATTVGTLAALALDRSELRGRDALAAALLTPAIVPVILVGLGIYAVFLRWQLAGTIIGLVLAHSVIATPLVVRSVAASLSRHDRTLEQAAANLGASPAAVLWQVTLPSILPGVLAGALFAFITSFDEIVISIFLTSPELQTLPVLMFNAVTQVLDPTIAAASSLILVCTTILILGGLRLNEKWATSGAI
jgi:putative spermidine/putrescine transport system permease protein